MSVDQAFAALSDPTRVEIVARLSRGSASVSELAEPYAMSLRGILKHVHALEDAGVIRTIKEGRVRRCELEPRRLDEIARWLDAVRQRWEGRVDRLAQYATKEARR